MLAYMAHKLFEKYSKYDQTDVLQRYNRQLSVKPYFNLAKIMAAGIVINNSEIVKKELYPYSPPRCDFTLTLDATGNTIGATIEPKPGLLQEIAIIPNTNNPPVDGFKLELLDDFGIDILMGDGSGITPIVPQKLSLTRNYLIDSVLVPKITNGGANAVVRVVLYTLSL